MFINIPSPTGEALQMGQYMQNALQQLGLTVSWQKWNRPRQRCRPLDRSGGVRT